LLPFRKVPGSGIGRKQAGYQGIESPAALNTRPSDASVNFGIGNIAKIMVFVLHIDLRVVRLRAYVFWRLQVVGAGGFDKRVYCAHQFK
jgi:hypothetical protein